MNDNQETNEFDPIDIISNVLSIFQSLLSAIYYFDYNYSMLWKIN